MKLILASSNQGKLAEFKQIFAGAQQLYSISDVIGATPFEPAETAFNYIDNAKIKVLAGVSAMKTAEPNIEGVYCLADDSGIEINALYGEPGILSGRYLREKGLAALAAEINAEEKPNIALDRGCRFVCSLILSDLDNNIIQTVEAYWYGWVVREPRGEQGFGFDPLVIPEEEIFKQFKSFDELREQLYYNRSEAEAKLAGMKTIAQLSEMEKNTFSHRARAVKLLENSLLARHGK